MKCLLRIAYLVVAALAFAGCGGGGGGSTSSSSAAIYITDDLNNGYDHVWVTIKAISVGKVGGGNSVVFTSSSGEVVDLKTLRDGTGRRFQFISMDDGLSGQYNSINVTLDENLVLYPTGATTGLNRIFAGASSGQKTLTSSFSARTFGSGTDDLVIDFDLSNWTDNGTEVTASIGSIFDDNSLNDESRHERSNYPGSVSDLSGVAPNQSFKLTKEGRSIVVQCSLDTQIHRSGGTGNPVLANGQHVVVRGAFDPTTTRLNAERVKITGNAAPGSHDEAFGTASAIDSGSGNFDLSIIEADDFVPAGDPVHVTTSGATFRIHSGAIVSEEEFFVALTEGGYVEVEGQYDAGTNTLSATKVKIEKEDGQGGGGHEDNAEITGATSLPNFGAGTFNVVATEFSGLNVAPGTVIQVHVTEDTSYRGQTGGNSITAEQFFGALTELSGRLAEVEGHWDGTVLMAKKCKLENN